MSLSFLFISFERLVVGREVGYVLIYQIIHDSCYNAYRFHVVLDLNKFTH